MDNQKTVKNSPEKVKLEIEKKYYWCTCGLSTKQPFCDGTHKAKGKFRPLIFAVSEKKEYFLCNFKKTKNPPFCDGSHK